MKETDARPQEPRDKPLTGFIGQGFIGKNYADDFERRGYPVVRYALENGYEKNNNAIRECGIVFIAVPTPTTPEGFDDSIVREVLPLVGEGKTAVIKSTLLPGTTERLQKAFPKITVLHSPEFLREASAAADAANPERNIVGTPKEGEQYQKKAEEVLAVLPRAPFERIVSSTEAELIKYAGNCFLYTKVVFINMLYDLAAAVGADWEEVAAGIAADSRIGPSHLQPVHESGRGAGGHCFIKDFAAFRTLYERLANDPDGLAALKSIEEKNIELLRSSGKDLDLLDGVYGAKLKEI